jgi:hypothetical protein
MNTTELIRPSEYPTFRQALAETIPLVGAIAGYGPPVIFLAGPWLLLALMLSAPFALLLTLIAVMLAAATVLVGLPAAILATPYLVMRRVHKVRERRESRSEPAARLVPLGSARVVS